MAKKTFRTIYWNDELESRVVRLAEKEDSSVSRRVRRAREQLLKNDATGFEKKSGAERESLPFAW